MVAVLVMTGILINLSETDVPCFPPIGVLSHKEEVSLKSDSQAERPQGRLFSVEPEGLVLSKTVVQQSVLYQRPSAESQT